jgi:hypothetical protein
MPPPPPKPIVTSWDVFDTLVARFVLNPHSVFLAIESMHNAPGFVNRRMDAQAALDRIGAPYVLHDIYRRMAADGLAPADARALLRAEVATETSMLFPVRRNVGRVEPADLIISDMYLPPEVIAGFLFDACDLHAHRPIVRSNWGKHTGTIWPLVLNDYVVRRHVGDNPVSDVRVPSGFGIACELVTDTQPTAWEMKLQELGLGQLALVQREVRLRATPPGAGAFHAAVVGPYFTILACFATYLVRQCGTDVSFAFLSRSADDLARVFVSMFPDVPAVSLDISRRLAADEQTGKLFASGIGPSTVVVDMVGTGRSYFGFAERHGDPGKGLFLFALLELILNGTEREQVEARRAAGRFAFVCRITGGGQGHWYLEHLMQSCYPPVASVAADPRSGGVVRRFGANELDSGESQILAWKSYAVTELVRTLRRRGFSDPGAAPVIAGMEQALLAVVADPDIMAPFSSFAARERMDWA